MSKFFSFLKAVFVSRVASKDVFFTYRKVQNCKLIKKLNKRGQ
ncbi:hypothetical protein [Helicobacter sp. 11S02629-2]|nr:hypothetical protein [Helicobacter sp. 11S02629-2]